MGGSSTSQSAVLREIKTGGSSAFDLHSWQGLTQVLKMGKESLSDPQAYAEFRNLVLSYAQQGGDAAMRKQIDEVIATFGATIQVPAPAPVQEVPQSSEKKVEPAPAPMVRSGVGTRRLEPQFKKEVSAPVVREVVAEPIPVVKEAPAPLNLPVEPEPIAPVVEKVPEVSLPPEPKKEVPAAAPAPAGFRTLDEHKARIAEIKRMVNAQVGNPAMLIDTHNDDGKQYMKALLAALKATGGGGSENVDAAMAVLEEATTRILGQDTSVKEESTAPEPVTIPDPVPEVPLPTPVVPEVEIPEPRIEPVLERKPQTETIHKADDTIASVMKDIQKTKESSSDTFTSFLIKDASVPKTESRIAPLSRVEEKTGEVPAPGFTPSNRQMMEGATKHSLEEIKKEHGVDTVSVITKQTELSSPEITAALHQLLDEWSIFQGKGFFGFGLGPSGKEHPLYATLAPLSMGEVIAGRWEGSDPKLKKTIKQYVDAWRHEQGIAYVITETFEHYLRRVVQRILKGQKAI